MYFTTDGYIYVSLGHRREIRLQHVLIAEKALGRSLPHGAVVHHVNGNNSDNRNANLVICENQGYHKLLHMRANLLVRGCDPNTQHICGHCKAIKPLNEFCVDRHRPNGRYGNCKTCKNELLRASRKPAEANA